MLGDIGSVGTSMARPCPRLGRGRRRWSAAVGVAAAVAMALSACASGQPTGLPVSGTASGQGASCAWPTAVSVQQSNIGVPDSAAFYWLQPVVAGADTRIVISGDYPDARYASLAVYQPDGSPFTSNGVGSSLSDYRIAADAGSTNPWQRPAVPGARFTVTVGSQVAPVHTNALPMPQGTTSTHPGYLVYRVYLPAGGRPDRVPLPTLTIHDGHNTGRLPPCRDHNAPIPSPVRNPTPTSTPSGPPAPTPPQLKFYKPAEGFTVNALLPNTDTAYALAYFAHATASSDVVVVRAKAPTSPPGSHPAHWPNPHLVMRYWSMCIAVGTAHLPTVVNTLSSGQTDYGCRADDATARNAAGDYTYVIGAESQRATIDRIPGVTFLPFATDQTTPVYVLLLRDTLVNPAFAHSTANVTQTGDPAAAAAVMGAYYPRISVCPLTTLTSNGCPS
jgi:hypothetical protein